MIDLTTEGPALSNMMTSSKEFFQEKHQEKHQESVQDGNTFSVQRRQMMCALVKYLMKNEAAGQTALTPAFVLPARRARDGSCRRLAMRLQSFD